MSKLVLFDFDGVIADTFDMAYQFHEEFGNDITRDEYRDMFMGNIYKSVRDGITDEEFDDHNKKWFDLYAPRVLKQEVFPGMDHALKNLAEKYVLVVISSSLTSPIREFLELNNLDQRFDIIYGADVHEDKTEKIQMTFDKYNAEAKDSVFITDTVGDVMEMNKVNIDSVVVTWGFHDRERFKDLQPYVFVDTVGELVESIDNYFDNG